MSAQIPAPLNVRRLALIAVSVSLVAASPARAHGLPIAAARTAVEHAEARYWHGVHVKVRVAPCRAISSTMVRCRVVVTGVFAEAEVSQGGEPASRQSAETESFTLHDSVRMLRGRLVVHLGPYTTHIRSAGCERFRRESGE